MKLKSQSQLNNSVLCWLFMLVVRVVQTATSKQRTKVLCALLVYLKDTLQMDTGVVWYGVHLTAEMKFCQITALHSLFKSAGRCKVANIHSSNEQ